MQGADLPDLTLITAIGIMAAILATPYAKNWIAARRERARTVRPFYGDPPYGDPGGWRPETPQEWVDEGRDGGNVAFMRIALAIIAIFVVAFASLAACSLALAHDSWISKGGYRSSTGEWCCGAQDCKVLNYTPRVSTGGYVLVGGEVVPYPEVQFSPDGTYVRCQRPDGSRRCFFAPMSTN